MGLGSNTLLLKRAGVLLIVFFLILLGMRFFGPSSLSVVQPTTGPAVQAVYATGSVEAAVMFPVSARSGARLVSLLVDEGSIVKKDQLLAQLEDEDLQHAMAELRARESLTEKEFERQSSLLKRHVASEEAFDRAKSEWNAAKASLAKAEAQARYMKLFAPADGVVIRRDGEIGQMIPANQPLFWLTSGNTLRITAEIDEEDIPMVQIGQQVLIRADAFPGKTFHGEVKSITPKGDPVGRSYRVRIEFSTETPLQIGMTAEVNIVVRESESSLLLPASAVQEDAVWLVVDGRLVRRKVFVGAKGEKQVEIREGIRSDDQVVLQPDAGLEEGKRVRVVLVP